MGDIFASADFGFDTSLDLVFRAGPTLLRVTQSDWHNHRDLIIQLYITEDKTLSILMKMMSEEHGFDASPKMYKTKFKEWGISKNLNEKDALDAMENIKDQLAAGRRPALAQAGSRLVPVRAVQQYVRRRRQPGLCASRVVSLARSPDIWFYSHHFLHYLEEWGLQCFKTHVWVYEGSVFRYPRSNLICDQAAYGFSDAIACFLALEKQELHLQASLLLEMACQYIPFLVLVTDFSIFETLLWALRDLRRRGLDKIADRIRNQFALQAQAALPEGDLRKLLYKDLMMMDLANIRLLEGPASERMESVIQKYRPTVNPIIQREKHIRAVLGCARDAPEKQKEMLERLEQQLIDGSQENTIAMFTIDRNKDNWRNSAAEWLEAAVAHFYIPLGKLDDADKAVRFLIKHYTSGLCGVDRLIWLREAYLLLETVAAHQGEEATQAEAIMMSLGVQSKLAKTPFARLDAELEAIEKLGWLGDWTNELKEHLCLRRDQLLERLLATGNLFEDFDIDSDPDKAWIDDSMSGDPSVSGRIVDLDDKLDYQIL